MELLLYGLIEVDIRIDEGTNKGGWLWMLFCQVEKRVCTSVYCVQCRQTRRTEPANLGGGEDRDHSASFFLTFIIYYTRTFTT